jgi:hypothetical protein
VKAIVIHALDLPGCTGVVTVVAVSSPARLDLARTLRGAASGALAAAVWGVQQPLDKRLFASRYDDVELLGRAVTSGPWYPLGFAIHVGNGAAFGAVYAGLRPSLPLPASLCGPAAALFEHVTLWPLGRLSDRVHPARDELPRLAGNRAAFLQSTWRHLLFGLVLGELERRLNGDPEDENEPPAPADYSSNGHGSFAYAVHVQQAD